MFCPLCQVSAKPLCSAGSVLATVLVASQSPQSCKSGPCHCEPEVSCDLRCFFTSRKRTLGKFVDWTPGGKPIDAMSTSVEGGRDMNMWECSVSVDWRWCVKGAPGLGRTDSSSPMVVRFHSSDHTSWQEVSVCSFADTRLPQNLRGPLTRSSDQLFGLTHPLQILAWRRCCYVKGLSLDSWRSAEANLSPFAKLPAAKSRRAIWQLKSRKKS